jgi:hypothetical protein
VIKYYSGKKKKQAEIISLTGDNNEGAYVS